MTFDELKRENDQLRRENERLLILLAAHDGPPLSSREKRHLDDLVSDIKPESIHPETKW